MKKIMTILTAIVMALTVMCQPIEASAANVKPIVKATQTVISKGAKTKVKVTYKNKNVTNKAKLKSSNKKVATVSKKGVVTGKKAGAAYITAIYEGKTSKKVKITVAQVSLNKKNVKLTVGKTATLAAKYNGRKVKPTYKSSNANVAYINRNGRITAKKKGAATITAIYKKTKATCKVTVVGKDGASVSDCSKTGHCYKKTQNFEIKAGYACNECYTDVTDWDDYYACHGSWHTHTWYIVPDIWTCENCGQKMHRHAWNWVEPTYSYDADTVVRGNYFECISCGANTRDESGKLVRINLWTTPYDFTNSGIIVEKGTFPDKGDVWELTGLWLDSNGKSDLVVGETLTLTPHYAPISTTTSKKLSWKSSDSSVAKVNNGIVAGISPGTATITATAQNGVSDSVKITVIKETHAITDFSIWMGRT